MTKGKGKVMVVRGGGRCHHPTVHCASANYCGDVTHGAVTVHPIVPPSRHPSRHCHCLSQLHCCPAVLPTIAIVPLPTIKIAMLDVAVCW